MSNMRTERSFIDLPFRSAAGETRLAFFSTWAKAPGPTVWLTAGTHGDEVGGTATIQKLFRCLEQEPIQSGRLCALPLINPLGFAVGARHVPLSGEDLNRAFPGKADGTVAERIAHLIYTTILSSQPKLLLDLHTDWRHSIPYTLIDPRPRSTNDAVYDFTLAVAAATGLPVVLDSDEYRGTLSYTMLRENVAAVSLELGESYVINETNIAAGVGAIAAVLERLGMMGARDRLLGPPTEILRYSDQPRASTSGLARFLIKPGDRVASGQALAEVYDVMDSRQEVLAAGAPALVLGHADLAATYPGAALISLGEKIDQQER